MNEKEIALYRFQERLLWVQERYEAETRTTLLHCDIARGVGISKSMFSKIYNGRQDLTAKQLEAMVDFLSTGASNFRAVLVKELFENGLKLIFAQQDIGNYALINFDTTAERVERCLKRRSSKEVF